MIFVDNAEAFSDIMNLLDAMDVRYERSPLRYGDFHISGKNGLMVIERKRSDDFVGSLVSGHLSDQLTRMSSEFDWSVLLIEGSVNVALAEGSVSRKTYYSALLGALMKKAEVGKQGRVSVITVETDWDTAMVLERAQYRLDDPKGLIRTPYVGAPQVAGGNPLVSGLCAVSGVGEVVAKGLLRFFGSVGRVATADVQELVNVPKVGDTIARAIYDHFRQTYEET